MRKGEKRILQTIGLVLYWAEGSKSRRARTVDLADSDPDTLRLFLRYLREVVGVDEQRLRVYLYCFEDQDVDALRRWWSKQLRIPIAQFQKPYIRRRGPNNGRAMPHGVAHVRYSDVVLLDRILKDIEKLRIWAGTEAVKRE